MTTFPKPLATAVAELRSAGRIVEAPPQPKTHPLSPAQIEAVLLYRSGYRGEQLATQLGTSNYATEQRLKRAMAYLGLSERAGLLTVNLSRILSGRVQ